MTKARATDVAAETATNKRYLDALRRRLDNPLEVSVSANQKWINDGPRKSWGQVELSPLVARIGLCDEVEDLGRDFYVGPRRLSGFDHPVVSWDAPVAKVFFQPEVGHRELDGRVAVRRTLVAQREEIVRYYDEETPALEVSDFPFMQKKLTVPSAPAPSARRAAAGKEPAQRSRPRRRRQLLRLPTHRPSRRPRPAAAVVSRKA